ncbi:MAG: hypothetical protein RLY71_3787 [Pseudomonadota bacterium]|jgi:hypothetical protein
MKNTPPDGVAGELVPTPPDNRAAALRAIRDTYPGTSCPAQCFRLLVALQTQQHITTLEASRYLDLYDPRARKMQLARAGHRILTTWRQVPTESGALHRIGVYSLVRGKPAESQGGTE